MNVRIQGDDEPIRKLIALASDQPYKLMNSNAWLVLVSCLLGGCAPRAMVRPTLDHPPVRFVLAPIQSSVYIRHLAYIHDAPNPLQRKEEQILIEQEMKRVRWLFTQDFEAKLSSSVVFVPTSQQDAEVEIRVTLEAYGRVPGTWLALIVGSGVGEAVAQGVIIAETTGNKWLATGVGAEELASENLTWLVGAYVTNRYLTPIILSCHIIRLSDHKTIWSKRVFRIYSRKIIARLSPDRRDHREDQLTALTNHALDELAVAMEKAWPKISSRARRKPSKIRCLDTVPGT